MTMQTEHPSIVYSLDLPGIMMEVENGHLDDHFPLQTGIFPLP